jgi:hypothetical protein
MKLVPKVTKPTTAIRLKKALTANAGDWLIIKDDESVEVVSDAVIRQVFTIERKAESRIINRPSGITNSSYRLSIHGKDIKISGQLGRVLVAFSEADMSHGAFVSQIRKYLNEKDAGSLTARLVDGEKLGFVTAAREERDPANKHSFLWKLTNNGREVARKIKEQG